MQNFERYLKVIFAIIATVVTKLLGGWDMSLEVLVYLIILDYTTGLSSAFISGKLSSQIGMKGIIKKVMVLCSVVLASQLDRLTNTNIVRTAVIYFYVANEGISILENLAKTGLPLPKQLKAKLLQIQGVDDSENN